jgi:hypothetical protein
MDLNGSTAIEKYKVGAIPTAYYVPNYITVDEEQQLLKHVRKRH